MKRVFTTYRVVGLRRYREHEPGTVFSAVIDEGAERRAVERGCLEVLGREIPDLEAGTFSLPYGWAGPPPGDDAHMKQSTEAPIGCLSH